MTGKQEAELRMPNRFLKSDKRFFVPFTPVQGNRPMHAPHGIVEFHNAADLRCYVAISHSTDSTTFAAFYRQKYSEAAKRLILAGRTPLKKFYNVCTQGAQTEPMELQAAALEIARTKAALKYSDDLYGKQRTETGLTSAQQFLAFMQKQCEQQPR